MMTFTFRTAERGSNKTQLYKLKAKITNQHYFY